MTPNKPADWIILGERLRELAEVCDGLTAGAPEVLAGVRQRLAACAASLEPPDAAGLEPEAGASARAVDPPAAVLEQVAAGRMPCDTAWPTERVALFHRWVRAGSPD